MDTRNTDDPCVYEDPRRVYEDTPDLYDSLANGLIDPLEPPGTGLEEDHDHDLWEPSDGAIAAAEPHLEQAHGEDMNLAIRPHESRRNPDPQIVKARADGARPTARGRAAFDREALVHLDALYGAALRLTRRPTEAEDLVQDTILRAWKKWDQFKQGTNCRAWLFRILTNTFINGYRRRTKEREILEAEHQGRLSDRFFSRDQVRAWADPERGYEHGHLSPIVQEALESLKPDFRTVVVLADLEGFAYKEIAEMVDCPIGTVMSRLFRARRALRGRLQEHAEAYGITVNA